MLPEGVRPQGLGEEIQFARPVSRSLFDMSMGFDRRDWRVSACLLVDVVCDSRSSDGNEARFHDFVVVMNKETSK